MLLEVANLEVCYGVISALQSVSLHIDRGEIVALIGANGAGKTTLLRTISGLIRPKAGAIRWFGNGQENTPELQRLRPDQIVQLGICQVPEGRQVFANLTTRENLLLGGYCRKRVRRDVSPDVAARVAATGGIVEYASPDTPRAKGDDPDPDVQRVFNQFPVLGDRRSQKAGTLSGGEQQMLAIGRALMAKPQLLLLDEPSLGLAPLIVRKIFQIIREINQQGTTIFLVEQNAHMALNISNRAYVLQTGQIIKADHAQNLLEDPDVKKAYLGG
jgi:branched-chain amino acid transport system ATP-binding protein